MENRSQLHSLWSRQVYNKLNMIHFAQKQIYWISKMLIFSLNIRPSSGCLQYHRSQSGRITTFNFEAVERGGHLANQDYSICMKQFRGNISNLDSFHIKWKNKPQLTISIVRLFFISSTAGYCNVQYDVCNDETNSFSISTPAFSPFATSQVDINCSSDHIVIEGWYVYTISPPM